MKTTIDVTPFAEQLFVRFFLRMTRLAPKGQLPAMTFKLREFCDFVIQFVYDYQVTHQMDKIAVNTGEMLGYEERQIRRKNEKIDRQNHFRT